VHSIFRFLVLLPFLTIAGGTCNPSIITFVPLHTYYIAASGCNDSNSGTSSGSPWCTPHHSVVCGDVIYAAPGSYSAKNLGLGEWGAVSSCPSTSGGIDGTGGIYAAQLICNGNVGTCSVTSSTQEAIRVDVSNWAVQGWQASTNTYIWGTCFWAIPTAAATIHDIYFVNDIANGCEASGFSVAPKAVGQSVDYFGVVGSIAYNTAKAGSKCYSGISVYEPYNSDTNAGTHIFIAGNISYDNKVPIGCGSGVNTDGNGIIFDDFGGTQRGQAAYTGQAVAEQNLTFGNSMSGIAIGGNSNPRLRTH